MSPAFLFLFPSLEEGHNLGERKKCAGLRISLLKYVTDENCWKTLLAYVLEMGMFLEEEA